MTAYFERFQEQIEQDITEDLARAEYKTQAIHCLALARNHSGVPDVAQVYATMANAYASLEQSRWISKGSKK